MAKALKTQQEIVAEALPEMSLEEVRQRLHPVVTDGAFDHELEYNLPSITLALLDMFALRGEADGNPNILREATFPWVKLPQKRRKRPVIATVNDVPKRPPSRRKVN